MTKLRYLFVACALCILCACAIPMQDMPSQSEQPPTSSQDLESIVEPLETVPPAESSEAAQPQQEESSEPQSGALAEAPPPVQEEAPQTAPQTEPQVDSTVQVLPKATPGSTSVPDTQLDTALIETELLRLINALRNDVGAESLGIEDHMQFAAKIRAGEVWQNFSHTRPNGSPYNTAFDEAGFDYAGKWHGENLASLEFTTGMFNEAQVAQELFSTLKNSSGHYQNMVNNQFLQAGIGVVANYNGKITTVTSSQLFSSL